jgi:hypothetical protein
MYQFEQNSANAHFYYVKEDLQELLKRLKRGMKVNGRILDKLSENRYIIRIFGYNLLTESEAIFNVKDEVTLTVLDVEPHLKLNISYRRKKNSDSQMDIIVY